ncbi:MAG: hypothetical protein DCF26_12470 [Burkholderiales bacterium]|nr:MAG: hypothetical protein DCF26_12470 [Burkholderiales bacterium]
MSITSRLSSPAMLRRVLTFDALSGAATGGLHLLLAPVLAEWLGLPEALLQASGVAIFAFVALAGGLALQASPSRGPLMAIVLLNVAWGAGCLWLAFGGAVDPAPLGLAYLLVQAAAVFVLAELEWMGARRLAGTHRGPLTA